MEWAFPNKESCSRYILDSNNSLDVLHKGLLSFTGGVSHVSPLPPVSKPVAFDIVLGRSDSDNKLVPLTNRPPRRLQVNTYVPCVTVTPKNLKLSFHNY